MNHSTGNRKLEGLIAATYTPLNEENKVDTTVIEPMVEHLIQQKMGGLYVCGSTGEGMSLSSDERKVITEAYVRAANRRLPVLVQVGHNSIEEAQQLAHHAQTIGADIVSATCPSYYNIGNVAHLVECMTEIASGAPNLPFYYYHIPALTGSEVDMVEFLEKAGDRIPNLAGLKYTDTKLHEFQACLEMNDGHFDVLWGCDEMLLGALATGAMGAIGSTYNVAAHCYHQLISAFSGGDVKEARRFQSLAISMIRIMARYPFHSAMKAVLAMQGFEMGHCRLPQEKLSQQQVNTLQSELKAIGFFEWAHAETAPIR